MWGRKSAAAVDGRSGTRVAQCPLCGKRFDQGESPACAGCPQLFRRCGMVVCPNCSHEFPRT